jgi:hypothetical protein
MLGQSYSISSRVCLYPVGHKNRNVVETAHDDTLRYDSGLADRLNGFVNALRNDNIGAMQLLKSHE